MTRQKMLDRDSARKKARKSWNQEDWNIYKGLRNSCNSPVRKDRVSHFKKLNDMYIMNNDTAGLYNRVGCTAVIKSK